MNWLGSVARRASYQRASGPKCSEDRIEGREGKGTKLAVTQRSPDFTSNSRDMSSCLSRLITLLLMTTTLQPQPRRITTLKMLLIQVFIQLVDIQPEERPFDFLGSDVLVYHEVGDDFASAGGVDGELATMMTPKRNLSSLTNYAHDLPEIPKHHYKATPTMSHPSTSAP
jgi:hypothetical protein